LDNHGSNREEDDCEKFQTQLGKCLKVGAHVAMKTVALMQVSSQGGDAGGDYKHYVDYLNYSKRLQGGAQGGGNPAMLAASYPSVPASATDCNTTEQLKFIIVCDIGFDSYVDDLSSVDNKGLRDKMCEESRVQNGKSAFALVGDHTHVHNDPLALSIFVRELSFDSCVVDLSGMDGKDWCDKIYEEIGVLNDSSAFPLFGDYTRAYNNQPGKFITVSMIGFESYIDDPSSVDGLAFVTRGARRSRCSMASRPSRSCATTRWVSSSSSTRSVSIPMSMACPEWAAGACATR